MTIEYLNNKLFESNISKFQVAKRAKTRFELILDDLNQSNAKLKIKSEVKEVLIQEKQVEYDKIMIDYNESQQQLAEAFLILSQNIIRYRKFHFVDIDDAVQEFAAVCFEKIDKFDPAKGKAFNYMTTCILNHYRQLYRTARNYNELKRKYHEHLQGQQSNTINNKTKQNNLAKNKRALYSYNNDLFNG